MALVVEDGSGKSNAESYLSVADADTYHTNHGDPSSWSIASIVDKEEALRMATQYLDLVYGMQWKETRSNEGQALDWPRANVLERDNYYIDSDEIPQALKDATAEMALRHVQLATGTSLLDDLDNSASVGREKVKVGAIELDTEYVGGNTPYKKYRKVDLLVADLTRSFGIITRG